MDNGNGNAAVVQQWDQHYRAEEESRTAWRDGAVATSRADSGNEALTAVVTREEEEKRRKV
ncbi:hypothetical protein Syun_025841 [Stephania yunnanensis]|uniref:Uncharacterized protein n=1 Tax=Stephania yunnanensis TaxID=152371 RepID=A0AAP0ESF8_9MAGN